MAWTDEARAKAAEKRKAAALKKRLVRAKEVFMSDRKKKQAKNQRRDLDTNKFAGFGDKNSYNPLTDSRAAKQKAKQDKMLDYIDARAEAATVKGGAIEKSAPKRNAAGKYTVDNAIVNKTLANFGTDASAQTRRNLTQQAANMAKMTSDGRTRVGTTGLKVTEVQAIKEMTKLARTMPVIDKVKAPPRGPKQVLERATSEAVRRIQASLPKGKTGAALFADLADDL
jgi:hypothetical protein